MLQSYDITRHKKSRLCTVVVILGGMEKNFLYKDKAMYVHKNENVLACLILKVWYWST